MKKIVKYILIAVIPILLLSGCCGKFQSPYVCDSGTCDTPVKTVEYVAPTKIVQSKPSKRVNRCHSYRCCVAYGIDGSCVAW